jgi:hypothetical protein
MLLRHTKYITFKLIKLLLQKMLCSMTWCSYSKRKRLIDFVIERMAFLSFEFPKDEPFLDPL